MLGLMSIRDGGDLLRSGDFLGGYGIRCEGLVAWACLRLTVPRARTEALVRSVLLVPVAILCPLQRL